MTTPIGQDAIRQQNQRLLEKIADKAALQGFTWMLAVSGMLATGGLILALSAAPGSTAARLAVVVIVMAPSALLFWLRARKSRAKGFVVALDSIVDNITSRERLQLDRVVPGGKVCDVIEGIGPANGSTLDIMWTFFYREEHTKGLIDLVRERKFNLRILLVAPWCRGLALRVSDLKRRYDGDAHLGLTELSMDNLNFIRDILYIIQERMNGTVPVKDRLRGRVSRHTNECFKILSRINVRFVTRYVGRPMIVVRPGGWVGWKRTLHFLRFFFFTQLWSNFGEIQQRMERAAIGLYLSRESSRYHFLMFHPDAANAQARGITHDMQQFFQSNWVSSSEKLEVLNFSQYVKSERRRIKFWSRERRSLTKARLISGYLEKTQKLLRDIENIGGDDFSTRIGA